MIHIHCDVDNLWIYEQEYGRQGSSQLYGHIYETALPRFCELVEQAGARATFFMIGKELDLPECQAFCRFAADRGHRFGNHSFAHPADFGHLSRAQKRLELERTDAALAEACGQQIVGFRGPGYWIDDDVVDVLEQLGYRYDSSVVPGPITPLMALYSITSGQRARGKAFGLHPWASRRAKPLGRGLLEIPVATATPVRLPVHSTIIFMMGDRGMRYFRRVVHWIPLRGQPSAYLFHAIDMAEIPDDHPLTAAVKPLQLPLARRAGIVHEILATLAGFGFETTEDYVADQPTRLGAPR